MAPSAVLTSLGLSVVGATGPSTTASPTTTVTDFVGPVAPTISGAVAGQRTTDAAPVDPFSGVTVDDPNAGASDMLTITLSNGGTTGALSGPGLAGGTAGVYTLTGSTAEQITTQLDGLVFTPTFGALGSVTPTAFALSDVSTAMPLTTVTDDTTTVSNTNPTNAILFQNTDGQASLWQLKRNEPHRRRRRWLQSRAKLDGDRNGKLRHPSWLGARPTSCGRTAMVRPRSGK